MVETNKILRGRLIGAALAALGFAGFAATAAQAEYPERPVTMVIPYGPGGATDISARTIAAPLGKAVPQPILMVNRGGAGGATGSVSVKNADADGYTMLFARVGSHTVNPAMKATLPYTLDDFRFVGVYEINPVACAVKTDSDVKTIDDLVAKVKANPGKVSYSSAGVGSLLHLAGAYVLREFGVANPAEDAIHLPLKSGGQAATAVLAGTADFICTNTSALASFVTNKQLRPLLVTTNEPVVGFDAPTAKDLGKPNLPQLVGWTGIAGPKGLPDDVAAKWRDYMGTATSDKEFVEKMSARGSVIRLMDPKESKTFIEEQYKVFRKLVDDLGMRIKG
ncbi:MAG: tripartite tricarboxylate transporter substrate binding protein [Alphaproteobacteria bacterium]|nr:tripartite tricarboxylate transporter substrate binding protein [Alphaproteobacteria bacterium]